MLDRDLVPERPLFRLPYLSSRRADRADTAIVMYHSWPDPARDALRQVLDPSSGSGDTWVPVLDIPRRDWNNGIQLERRAAPVKERSGC
jgi:hypothetical protein